MGRESGLRDSYPTHTFAGGGINSQIPTKRWHELLADPTLADAICDGLVHNAHVIALQGASMREKKGHQAVKPTTTR